MLTYICCESREIIELSMLLANSDWSLTNRVNCLVSVSKPFSGSIQSNTRLSLDLLTLAKIKKVKLFVKKEKARILSVTSGNPFMGRSDSVESSEKLALFEIGKSSNAGSRIVVVDSVDGDGGTVFSEPEVRNGFRAEKLLCGGTRYCFGLHSPIFCFL